MFGSPEHEENYRKFGMGYFVDIVGRCDAVAFIRFPDGAVGAGVGKEIASCKGPILDVTYGFMVPSDRDAGPVLSVEETRARIAAHKVAVGLQKLASDE